MRVAVVGHVEWVEFVRVEQVPRPGEIVHALETWEEPGGGGAVAAAAARAARRRGCTFFTALGADELGRPLARGARPRSASTSTRDPGHEPTRRAFTYVDETGERTITVLGDKLRPRGGDSRLPWRELGGLDAVFFVSGDAEALPLRARRPRARRDARELATLREAGVELDALVGSGEDEGERYRPGRPRPAAASRRHDRRRRSAAGCSRAARSGLPRSRGRSWTPTGAATPSPPA